MHFNNFTLRNDRYPGMAKQQTAAFLRAHSKFCLDSKYFLGGLMSFRHYNLTLDAGIQRLSSVLAIPQLGGADDIPLRLISLQLQGDSAGPLYVGGALKGGGAPVLTSTNHGFRLEPGAGGVPAAPLIFGEFETGPLRLSDFYVLGSATEILHIAILGY